MIATAVVAAIIVSALYLGRDVFVPVALAILLSFVLAPLVGLLQRWRVPRAPAVGVVVLLAFVGIFSLGGLLASQVTQLAADLPRYQATIRDKIQTLRGATSNTLRRAADLLQDLGQELSRPTEHSPSAQGSATSEPIPVEVHQPSPTALEDLAALISPLLRLITTTGIVAIFVVFILLQREDLRDRFIKLAGPRDLRRTTTALDDAATRLSRLFFAQLALNSTFGIIIGGGLWAIGVPSPLLWGVLAAILRFVPYIGAIIAAVFPLILATAVDPGWSMLAWTAALFLVAEPVIGQVIEPIAYGHSTGLSPVAVVASATFWTALWGPVGLVLATPLTICLVVLGRHVERFGFLDVMLGDRPALLPPELFYQRMLAEDPAEAVDKAEEFLKQRSLSTYYDDVALPGLLLAQNDLARGALDRTQAEMIRQAVVEVVDDLDDEEDRTPMGHRPTSDVETAAAVEQAKEKAADFPVLDKQELAAEWRGETPIICAAGRGPLDEAAAAMLVQLLRKHGLSARVESADAIGIFNVLRLDTSGVAVVCLSYLDCNSTSHMRYLIRRLRRRLPGAKIILGCWQTALDHSTLGETTQPDAMARTLKEAIKICLDEAGAVPPPGPSNSRDLVAGADAA